MTDDSADTPRQSIQLPAVLSRTSIYTSLKSYDQATASTTDSQQKTSNSIQQDSQLYSFYSRISMDFHRGKVGLDCKNTAGRPHSASDVNNRIQQRALTLTTNASFHKRIGQQQPQGQQYSSGSGGIMSRSKRKQKNQEILLRIGYNNCNLSPKHHEDFLQKLNQQWNTYMVNLLWKTSNQKDHPHPSQQPQMDVTDDVLAKSFSFISDRACSIEWIGAKVRVDQCQAMQSKVGLVGILVAQTSRTWRVAPLISLVADAGAAAAATEHNTDRKRKTKTNFSKEKKKRRKSDSTTTTTIPKQGTHLTAMVELPESIQLLNHQSRNILCITLGWNNRPNTTPR
jgi:hypothetical protein